MSTAQPQLGILAFGTTNHAYLELDRHPYVAPADLAKAVGVVKNAVLTGAGCTVVVGFRPEIWRQMAPHACPEALHGYDAPVVGDDGFGMPGNQHDLIVWVAGGSQDVVFDAGAAAMAELSEVATVAEENEGWSAPALPTTS